MTPLRGRSGQMMIEYLAIALAIIVTILAATGLITGKAQSLMNAARTQFLTSGGTADSLLR